MSEWEERMHRDFPQMSDEETRALFAGLDTNHDEKIYYSDFLACMLGEEARNCLVCSSQEKFLTVVLSPYEISPVTVNFPHFPPPECWRTRSR